MTTIKSIDKFMSSLAPKNLSEVWDNDGVMVCEDISKQVKKVLICLDATDDTIEYAARGGFDVIISHHPYIFKKLSRITEKAFSSIQKLISGDICVLSYHTRLDSAKDGVNDVLAKLIGLSDITGFGGEREDFGRVGTLSKEMSGKEFALHLKNVLGCDIKCTYSEKPIKKVAVLGGAGKDFVFDAIAAGADAYVTSEIAHNYFIDAKKYDFALYDCGHYYTENPVCNQLRDTLSKQFSDVEFEVFDIKCPYICY